MMAIVHVQFPLTTLVTWECTIRHAVPWAALEGWFALHTSKSAFMAATMEKSLAYERAKTPQPAGWIACDPLIVALAAEDSMREGGILIGSECVRCYVELAPGAARGQSVFQRKEDGYQGPCVRLVTNVDIAKFEHLLCDSLR